jgi:hypothetical protein
MLIDLEHKKLLQERLYDKKLKEIEGKMKDEFDIKKEMKRGHEVKLE